MWLRSNNITGTENKIFNQKIDYFGIENNIMCMWQQLTFLSSCTRGASEVGHNATCFFLK